MDKSDNPSKTPREQEIERLRKLIAKRPLRDDSLDPGVLLSDVIKRYANSFELISPFDDKNLKPACYKLYCSLLI